MFNSKTNKIHLTIMNSRQFQEYFKKLHFYISMTSNVKQRSDIVVSKY